MEYAKTRNRYLIYLESAETEIRRIVKDGYFSGTPKTSLNKKAAVIIRKYVRPITIPALQSAAMRSLWDFYERQWREISTLSSMVKIMILCFLAMMGKRVFYYPIGSSMPKEMAERMLSINGYTVDGNTVLGMPLNIAYEKYFNEYVRPVFNRLIKQFPKDPDDISGRNSLRNRAEMEVRYQWHKENIEQLKESGTKLVIASSHTDCSERCLPWQARVYSLDGTSGITSDGRSYVPLETATDIYYTTKAGITYKNGLLGFNCRHYLVAYKPGLHFRAVGDLQAYHITQEQRRMERAIVRAKTKAVMYQGASDRLYMEALSETRKLEKIYREYSWKHHRPTYPQRTKIL